MTTHTSKWITIPEEDSNEPVLKQTEAKPEPKESWFKRAQNWLNGEIEAEKPAPEQTDLKTSVVTNLEETLAQEGEVIKHKWFWASGFVAVMVFTAVLLVPDELSAQLKSLIPGNLFTETVNEAIDNYEGLNVIPPFPGSNADLAQQEEETAQQDTFGNGQTSGNQVVQPNAEAVDVQVDPVPAQVDEPAEIPEQNSETQQTPDPQNNPNLQPAAPTEPAAEESSPAQDETQDAALAAQQALIGQLTQELEAFKQRSNTQAQQLSGNQTLYPAAGQSPTGVQTAQILGDQPSITATQPTPGTTITPTPSTTAQPTTTYRLNPYKVTVTPQQILAQNQGKIAAGQTNGIQLEAEQLHQMQANAAAANAQLGQVQGTPQSGPMELIWVALALGLFVGFKTLRRRV